MNAVHTWWNRLRQWWPWVRRSQLVGVQAALRAAERERLKEQRRADVAELAHTALGKRFDDVKAQIAAVTQASNHHATKLTDIGDMCRAATKDRVTYLKAVEVLAIVDRLPDGAGEATP